MGSVIEELIRSNTPNARLIAADAADEYGFAMLAVELRGSESSTAEFPNGYGDGYGYGDGDGYGYGYGDGYGCGYGYGYGDGYGYGYGDGYGDGYGYGYGDGGIGSRQWC